MFNSKLFTDIKGWRKHKTEHMKNIDPPNPDFLKRFSVNNFSVYPLLYIYLIYEAVGFLFYSTFYRVSITPPPSPTSMHYKHVVDLTKILSLT